MAVLDAPSRSLARRLIRKFGKPCTYVHVAGVKHFPGESSVWEDPAEAEYATRCVLERVDVRLVDGTTVQAEDRMAYLPASELSVEPTNAGRLKIGAVSWQVVRVEAIYSGEQAALYKLQVRR